MPDNTADQNQSTEQRPPETDIPVEYRLSTYEYELPTELIAQEPARVRDESRLMLINRKSSSISHHYFKELPYLLNESDVLVLNETAVIPVQIKGHKSTGGSVELLALNPAVSYGSAPDGFGALRECLVKTSKPLKNGQEVFIDDETTLRVAQTLRPGRAVIQFPCADDGLADFLKAHGRTPLPPYIKPKNDSDPEHRRRYQTIYSRQPGSVAAPTAGLHFTDELLKEIEARGITVLKITLHVGLGTFMPMRDDDIRLHKMETESFDIPEGVAGQINSAVKSGRRIVAVGSTSMRTLESAAKDNNSVMYGPQHTDLFIKPGYKFRVAGAMITNFHLPHSTLLSLVASFSGISMIKEAYAEAIKHRYRFFSYGDASLII